jgi:RNA polymerase sigma factor (TIGR02999 family)
MGRDDEAIVFIGMISGESDLQSLSREDVLKVYSELRAIAEVCFRGQSSGHTLQPTALVNEAIAKMIRSDSKQWESKTHFLAIAAKAMRHILIDHSRRKRAEKRGADFGRVTLSGAAIADPSAEYDALDVDEALVKLEQIDGRQAKVVELRFFGGMNTVQIAEIIGVSPRTVELDWRYARAWLRRELTGEQDD